MVKLPSSFQLVSRITTHAESGFLDFYATTLEMMLIDSR